MLVVKRSGRGKNAKSTVVFMKDWDYRNKMSLRYSEKETKSVAFKHESPLLQNVLLKPVTEGCLSRISSRSKTASTEQI